ncbi:PREDICTED: pterin-4-alpha-carbinolamine dehydratase 2 isoform X1 [Cercocebus atys]|uniref:pterin-4-alpha-carbinolamine dehydratase 2 isoform X1 n=1 Tax=Cercocebus atys TaxID=9531 RepID=UPI0005F551A1|nr:PREDICTED: pterin-4-alpha-carbinolamine dehydratase 2 isoform X1 [Cercocebus atys]
MTEQSLRSNPRLQDLGAHDGICRGSLPQGVLNERQRAWPRASAAELPRPGLRHPPTRMDCAAAPPSGEPQFGASARASEAEEAGALGGAKFLPAQRGPEGKASARRRACVRGTDATGPHGAGTARAAAGPAAVGRRRALATTEDPGGLRGPGCACARGKAGRCPHTAPAPGQPRRETTGAVVGGRGRVGGCRGLPTGSAQGSPRQTANGGGALGAGGDSALVGGAARPEPTARGCGIWLYVPSCPTSREDESSPRMVQCIQQGPDNSHLT